MNSDDDRLRSLPCYDVAPRAAGEIRRRAHVLLRQQEQRLKHPAAFWWATCYHRVVEPALLLGLGFVYLAWTVRETVALAH
jgi:hypothetical protein